MFNTVKVFAVGGIVGLAVSIFTIILIRRLAKRVKRYELTYVPMTLVESKLWQWALIAYPLAFAATFAAIYAMGFMK